MSLIFLLEFHSEEYLTWAGWCWKIKYSTLAHLSSQKHLATLVVSGYYLSCRIQHFVEHEISKSKRKVLYIIKFIIQCNASHVNNHIFPGVLNLTSTLPAKSVHGILTDPETTSALLSRWALFLCTSPLAVNPAALTKSGTEYSSCHFQVSYS